ncbi:MAG: SMP-30/gluconolactonase/LRE family protein [Rubripirellula sp.]
MRVTSITTIATTLAITLLFSSLCNALENETLGRIERRDSQLDQFIAPDTKIEVLAKGFTWSEGPVWVGDVETGHLLFSDIPRNTIFKWTPDRGIQIFMQPSGYTGVDYYGLEPGSNGLALDPKGRLTLCEHGDRRVSVLTAMGGKRTLVDHYQGKRLNSPNDLVFDNEGNLFFTDPPYGLPNREKDERRELDFCGVYRLDTTGELTLVSTQLDRPNGIGFSPDQKTLYVAQSDPSNPIWMSFPVRADKSLGKGTILQDAKEFMQEYPGLPDGLAVHSNGTIFASGPGGIYVMTPKGKLIGRLVTGGRTSNCAFGPDEKNLYITADSRLCKIPLR